MSYNRNSDEVFDKKLTVSGHVEPVVMCEIPLNLLGEIKGYLTAAECGSMSKNNSEALADELLDALNKLDT